MKKILVTGADGFVGKNLVAELKKDRELELFTVDVDAGEGEFERYALGADFIVHLAGVNRPMEESEFFTGNAQLTSWLVGILSSRKNPPPVLLTSSIQSDLANAYGKSKREAENIVFQYGKETKTPVYVFKLPNLFGKWGRPDYNSVVATFCHNITRSLPVEINDPERELTLCYIDEVIRHIKEAIDGRLEPGDDGYCEVGTTYKITLRELADTLIAFSESRETLLLPPFTGLKKALYSTYLSYLPSDGFSYPLTAHSDPRGSFYEFLKTEKSGQFSVSTTQPGVTRGNHWHHTKVEKFLVIGGQAAIRFRRIGDGEVLEYRVCGEKPEVLDIPAGYTHSITNTSETETLITLIWANEQFDPDFPDTFFEEV